MALQYQKLRHILVIYDCFIVEEVDDKGSLIMISLSAFQFPGGWGLSCLCHLFVNLQGLI